MTQGITVLNKDSRGFVIPLFAAFSSLFVLLLLRMCIDLPTHQAAVIRAQTGIDAGNEAGMARIWEPIVAARGANAMASAMALGKYSPANTSLFFNSVAQSVTAVPMFSQLEDTMFSGVATSSTLVGTTYLATGTAVGAQSISADSYFDPNLPASARTFKDLGRKFFNMDYQGQFIQDFGNGIIQHMTFKPFSYLAPLSVKPASVVGALRQPNTFIGLLIDPAMPLDSGLYDRIFLTADSNDPPFSSPPEGPEPGNLNFPLAAYRTVPDLTDVIANPDNLRSSIGYPEPTSVTTTPPEWSINGFIPYSPSLPPGVIADSVRSPFSYDPSGTTNLLDSSLAADNYKLYRSVASFYSAACDTLPFFNYKSAAVNFIDRLARSSATSPTTALALLGYPSQFIAPSPYIPGWTPDDAVVPIFPVTVGSIGYDEFVPPSAYPLQLGTSSAETIYLHQPRTRMFKGWVNPGTFVPSNSVPSNHPELAFCSEYYLNSQLPSVVSGIAGPRLLEDFSGSNGEPAVLNYWNEAKRQRSRPSAIFNRHWYDDDFPSTSTEAQTGLHQSGTTPTTGGETPRNIVGSLAIRMTNYHLPELVANPSGWTRPDYEWFDPNNPVANDPNKTHTGYRYLPTAIRKMCRYISAASDAYNNDPTETYGKIRPIEQQILVVLAFGISSTVAQADLGVADLSTRLADLEDALSECLCNRPDFKLVMGMLPIDGETFEEDFFSMVLVARKFEIHHNNQCAGQALANEVCNGQPMGTLVYLPYSPTNSRYANASPALTSEQIVLKLTQDYATYFYETVFKLITRWNYAV